MASDPLTYAVVERERRFLVARVPDGVVTVKQIVDHYLENSRLRLREITEVDGSVVRKLGHKVRVTPGPEEVACTTMYLDDQEWELLRQLPARTLHKTRHIIDLSSAACGRTESRDRLWLLGLRGV